ncbi:hypothetical protein GCM10010282_54070 [Streptomyces roseolus]|nr:hypothetical protein GCM10010282_54070 [Streptomyces roseolus]
MLGLGDTGVASGLDAALGVVKDRVTGTTVPGSTGTRRQVSAADPETRGRRARRARRPVPSRGPTRVVRRWWAAVWGRHEGPAGSLYSGVAEACAARRPSTPAIAWSNGCTESAARAST